MPLYGWVAQRLPRQRFLAAVILFFVGCIQLFFLGSRVGVPHLGFVFFVWVGHLQPDDDRPVLVVRERDLLPSRGRSALPADRDRLHGRGAARCGRRRVAVRQRRSSPFLMMEIAAAILLVHLGLYRVVARRMAATAGRPAQEPIKAGNGFALVLKSPYLRLVALLPRPPERRQHGRRVHPGAGGGRPRRRPARPERGLRQGAPTSARSTADYFFWTNVAAIVLQAFVVSRIVKRFGMRGAVLALPIVALGAYGFAAAGAGLMVLRSVKIAENSTDYSVMNTAKQMIWLPTSREEKYKAKQAIDTFFVRAGDMLAAGLVFLGTHVFHAGESPGSPAPTYSSCSWPSASRPHAA